MKFPKVERENFVLFFVTFFMGLSLGITGPILPEIRSEFNLTYSTVALVLSSFGFARLILTLPSGYLYGRTSRKRLLSIGITLLAVGAAIAGLSHSFVEFIVSQVIMGAGFSICLMTIMISLSTSATVKNRGSVLGMNAFSRTAASVVAPIIAGFIAVAFNWRYAFLFYAIVMLFFLALVFTTMFKDKKIVSKDNSSKYRPSNAIISVFFAIFIIFIVGAGFRGTIIPLYSRDVLNMNTAAIGMVMSVSSLIYLFIGPASAFLSDRHGRKFFLSLGILLTAVSLVMFLFITTVTHLVILSIVLGFSMITYVIPAAMIGDMTRNIKKDFSIMRFVSELGFVFGPVILGVVADVYGFKATAIVACVLTVLSFIAIEIFVKEEKHHLNWRKVLQLSED
ncbi:MAG: MFS transporter [Candidatus Aenigmatarchaeota archaeon]